VGFPIVAVSMNFVRPVLLAVWMLCASAQAGEVVVSAASSLSEAMNEAAGEFEKQYPTIRVVFNFGGSGALAQQVRHGAPADVYVSASKVFMDGLVGDGFIRPETVRDLWSNRLVLVGTAGVDTGSGWSIVRSDDVRRIALGETRSVPAGRYGREVLEHLGLWDDVRGKIVYTKNVRQALSYVSSGAAQAGIVYETDVHVVEGLTVLAFAPPGSHEAIVYPAGITSRSKNVEEAQALVRFLASPQGSAHFLRHGFVIAGDGQ
jgi:molybdate transport system substrate-binding protein